MSTAAAMLEVVVARKSREADDICSLELVAADGKALPAFSAGSHIDVELPGGLVRQYSLCNDPTESHRYLIAVLLTADTRGGSRAVHAVKEGERLRIGAPRNHFALAHDARRSLLLAGGIGVTPILCMAERLANSGADFELHYCTRTRSRTAFADRIAASGFAQRAQFHYDDSGPPLDIEALLAQPEPGRHVYVCGPAGLIDAVLGCARHNGWPESQLHFEFFSAQPVPTGGDAAFEVQIASSGRVVVVPKERSVVQALAEAGIEVMTSCEQGVCGTCLTRVIDGMPDHRDVYLTQDEQAKNDQFTPCCSRAKSARLVLDL